MMKKRIISIGILCATMVLICVEGAKHRNFEQEIKKEEVQTQQQLQETTEKQESEPDFSYTGEYKDYTEISIEYLNRWKQSIENQTQNEVEYYGMEESGQSVTLHFGLFDEEGIPYDYRTLLQVVEKNGNYYVISEEMLDLSNLDSYEKAMATEAPYFFMYGLEDYLGEKEGMAACYCMADLILANWKRGQSSLLEECKDPVNSLKKLLHIPKEFSGEFYPISMNSGMVEINFEDAKKVSYYVEKKEDIWFTGWVMNEEYATQIKQVHEYITQVTLDKLKQAETFSMYNSDYAWQEISDQYTVLSDLPKENATLYGLYGGDAMVLRVKNKIVPLYLYWDSPQMIIPELYAGDFDQDGKEDYIVKTHMKTGTGVSGDELYFIKEEQDQFYVYEFEEEDWGKQLERVTFSYDEEYKILSLLVDGEYIDQALLLNEETVEELGTVTDIDLSCIMEFRLYDDVWYLNTWVGCYHEKSVIADYEDAVWIRSPITIHEDGSFSLGEITGVKNKYYYDFIDEEEDHTEKVVNVVYADVIHDGTDDAIVTSVSYSEGDEELSPSELLDCGECCYVRVYNGKDLKWIYQEKEYEKYDGYDIQASLLSMDFANAHAGNGQLFLTYEDKKAYLLYHSPWSGQGMGEYYYELFSMDETGAVYDKEESHFSFCYEEGAENHDANQNPSLEEATQYTQKMKKWIENGKLLVITDVCEEAKISTTKDQYQYDIRTIWKESPYEILTK